MKSWHQKLLKASSHAALYSAFLMMSTPLLSATLPEETVYVANSEGNTVRVIDVASNQVVAKIIVGSCPFALARAETGMYVANASDGTLSIIDVNDMSVVKTLPVLAGPMALALDGATGMYVANESSNNVNIIDTTTQTIAGTVPVGGFPAALALDGATGMYVANALSQNVSIIDTTTQTVSGTIAVGNGPNALALDGATGMYVANEGSNNVNIIDTTTQTVAGTVAVGNAPRALTRAGTAMYVANINDNSVSVIDTTTLQVVDTISDGIGSLPIALAAVPPQAWLWVIGASASPSISVVDIGKKEILTAAPTTPFIHIIDGLPSAPFDIAFSETNGLVYVSFADKIGVFDVTTRQLLGFIPVTGSDFKGLAFVDRATMGDNSPRQDLFAADFNAMSVDAIDTRFMSLANTIPSGSGPVALEQVGAELYVANYAENSVSVIDLLNQTSAGPTIAVGINPIDLASGGGTALYVANSGGSGSISIIDVGSKLASNTITGGILPVALALGNTGMFVANGAASLVHVIDTTTQSLSNTIAVGGIPAGLVLAGTRMYVAYAPDTLDVIDINTLGVVESITGLGTGPNHMAVTYNKTSPALSSISPHANLTIDTNPLPPMTYTVNDSSPQTVFTGKPIVNLNSLDTLVFNLIGATGEYGVNLQTQVVTLLDGSTVTVPVLLLNNSDPVYYDLFFPTLTP